MKLKIRGLIFTGFAAAVFAQSATAAIVPPSLQDPAHPDELTKTVVSQDYTDETCQERLQGDYENAPNMALEENKDGVVIEKAAFIGWNYSQNNENKEWVKLEGKKQVDGNNGYIEIEHDATNKKHYVQMNDTSITKEDLNYTGAQKIEDAGGQNATDLQKNRLTTAKAVYDFVNDQIDDVTGDFQPKSESGNGGLWATNNRNVAGVGVQTGTGNDGDPVVARWYELAPGQDGAQIVGEDVSTPYTRIYRDDGASGHTAGVYVDMDHNRVMVASTYTGNDFKKGIATVGTSYLSQDGMALATAGAVKEYVDTMVGGQVIPAAPNACTQSGVHCALVTIPHAADGTHPQAYVTLEWTVMAKAPTE